MAVAVLVNDDDDDGLDPPVNPYLMPHSPWPMTHRNPYCQQSTPWPGPTKADELTVEFLWTRPGTSTVIYDPRPYHHHHHSNNHSTTDSSSTTMNNSTTTPGTVLWTHNPFHTGRLLRTKNQKLQKLDAIANFTLDVLSGAYYVLDRDGILYTARQRALRAFGVTAASSSSSRSTNNSTPKLVKLREIALIPDDVEDSIVGLNILYDGNLVYTTAGATVGVVSRDFQHLYSTLQLGETNNDSVPVQESISNMMAVDEENGIYIVTSVRLYRVQWDPTRAPRPSLTIAWSAVYETSPRTGARLGEGSGTTPTLMGTTGNNNNEYQQDKLVLIADAAPLMHLVAYWRDEIPTDWVGFVDQGLDRRVAARVPLQFGNPHATHSATEQSVVVRGYRAAVVNNDYGRLFRNLPGWTPNWVHQSLVAITNWPGIAPYGVEQWQWQSDTRQLVRTWTNPHVSCPNGVPAMSASSNLFYCIGQRHGRWNLEAIDWTTGESVYHQPASPPWSWWPPSIVYNSAYSCLIVGMDREIVSGTAAGIVRFVPAETETASDATKKKNNPKYNPTLSDEVMERNNKRRSDSPPTESPNEEL